MRVGEVIDAYNRALRSLGADEKHDRNVSRKVDRTNAAAFLRWCLANEIDPLTFLKFRFRRASRHRFPLLKDLISDEASERFASDEAGSAFERELKHQMEATGRTEQLFELIRLGGGEESFRMNYLLRGKTSLCEVFIRTSTGYHPGSVACPQCPNRESCAERLNQLHGFDAVAVRAGDFSGAPARIASQWPELLQRLTADARRGGLPRMMPLWVRAAIEDELAKK